MKYEPSTEEKYEETQQGIDDALAKNELYSPGDIPPYWQDTLNRYGIRILQLAMTFGLVVPEYTMKDYILHAIANPAGYETVNIWGCNFYETEVITSEGIMTIGELYDKCYKYKNVKVLSLRNNKLEWNNIHPFYTGKQIGYEINTDKGTVFATEEHPFHTLNGWKKVRELCTSDKLTNLGKEIKENITPNFEYTSINSIKKSSYDHTYNLEVDNAHNFFLGNGVLTHNSQGSKKSCRTLSIGYWAYQDWDTVLEEIVLLPDAKDLPNYRECGFIQKLKSISKEEVVPLLSWDDYTVGMPSSTFKTDIEVYGAIDAAWAAIRTKVKVMVLNCPLIDRIGRNVKDNITLEVMIGDQVEQIERFVRLVGLKHLESNFFKVQVEPLHKFDFHQVPKDVFEEYFELRKEIADYAVQKMGKAFKDETEMLDDMMTPCQIMEEIRISPDSLSDKIKRGFISSEKINGKVYIPKKDFEDFKKYFLANTDEMKRGRKIKERSIADGVK